MVEITTSQHVHYVGIRTHDAETGRHYLARVTAVHEDGLVDLAILPGHHENHPALIPPTPPRNVPHDGSGKTLGSWHHLDQVEGKPALRLPTRQTAPDQPATVPAGESKTAGAATQVRHFGTPENLSLAFETHEPPSEVGPLG